MMQGQHVQGPLATMMPVWRCIGTIAIGVAGMFISSTVGSLAYPVGGVGVVFGAIGGFFFFSFLGCCVTGFYLDFFPSSSDVFNMSRHLPEPLAIQVGGKGIIQLVLTVHQAKNVQIQGQIPWTKPDLYVQVLCGKNPERNTCVNKDAIWNEQMKLVIDPLDQTILLRLKNQDLFGSSDVGYVCVDVAKHILEAPTPFPHNEEFPIQSGQGDYLRYGNQEKPKMVLSFTNVDVHNTLQDQKRKYLVNTTTNQHYGSVDQDDLKYMRGASQYVATMQFNPTMAIKATDP